MTAIEQMLVERGKRYGDFTGHAVITQDIKWTMKEAPKWGGLAPDQKEALEMIAHKIGRILNGDPDYADSWEDIAGYAKLVANRLNRDCIPTNEPTPQPPPLNPKGIPEFFYDRDRDFIGETTGGRRH